MENFDTLFNRTITPKCNLSVECATVGNLGYHFWLEIKGPIKVLEIEDHEITFKYNHNTYVYWANMEVFLRSFWSIADVREVGLNSLL